MGCHFLLQCMKVKSESGVGCHCLLRSLTYIRLFISPCIVVVLCVFLGIDLFHPIYQISEHGFSCSFIILLMSVGQKLWSLFHFDSVNMCLFSFLGWLVYRFINFTDLSNNQPLTLLIFSITFLFSVLSISPLTFIISSACARLNLLFFLELTKARLRLLSLNFSYFLKYAFNAIISL